MKNVFSNIWKYKTLYVLSKPFEISLIQYRSTDKSPIKTPLPSLETVMILIYTRAEINDDGPTQLIKMIEGVVYHAVHI